MLRIELIKQAIVLKCLAKNKYKWDFSTFAEICKSKLAPDFIAAEYDTLYCGFGGIKGLIFNPEDSPFDMTDITDVVVDFTYSPPIVEHLGQNDKKGRMLVDVVNKWLNEDIECPDKRLERD